MNMSLNNRGQHHFDYAVIGDGCMGVSTALALQKEWPEAKIILIGRHETKTASKDTSRIIRTPYFDEEYVLLAREAKKKWETELPYRDFFHRTGWIQVVKGSTYKPFFPYPEERLITMEDFSQKVHLQGRPQLEPGEELWISEDIGLVESSVALEAVASHAADQGVQREVKDVSKLLIKNDACYGVKCVDGSEILANTTIVATGAWTPAFLESSKVHFPASFFSITAICVATLFLHEDEYARFKSMPIIVTESGELIPPVAQERALRITSTRSFNISHPDELKLKFSAKSADTNRILLEKMIPELKGRPLNYWLCPELMTPYQHPLVDQAPGIQGLHLAVGGSYHSFKFLPVLGDRVVEYLKGIRSGVLKRWGWSRSEEKISVHEELMPKARV